MAQNPVQNYFEYIQAMTMFAKMTRGCAWITNKIKKHNVRVLDLLIAEEMEQKAIKGLTSKIPHYVLNLWHHLLSKITHIQIDWGSMKCSGLYCDMGWSKQYGYGAFSSFLSSDSSSLNFSAFVNILPNLESIDLYKCWLGEWKPIMSLE
eukprot:83714_1